MPWDAATFRRKHAKSLTAAQAARAAAVANSVLKRTGDEGHAIVAGIQVAKGRIKPRRKT